MSGVHHRRTRALSGLTDIGAHEMEAMSGCRVVGSSPHMPGLIGVIRTTITTTEVGACTKATGIMKTTVTTMTVIATTTIMMIETAKTID